MILNTTSAIQGKNDILDAILVKIRKNTQYFDAFHKLFSPYSNYNTPNNFAYPYIDEHAFFRSPLASALSRSHNITNNYGNGNTNNDYYKDSFSTQVENPNLFTRIAGISPYNYSCTNNNPLEGEKQKNINKYSKWLTLIEEEINKLSPSSKERRL